MKPTELRGKTTPSQNDSSINKQTWPSHKWTRTTQRTWNTRSRLRRWAILTLKEKCVQALVRDRECQLGKVINYSSETKSRCNCRRYRPCKIRTSSTPTLRSPSSSNKTTSLYLSLPHSRMPRKKKSRNQHYQWAHQKRVRSRKMRFKRIHLCNRKHECNISQSAELCVTTQKFKFHFILSHKLRHRGLGFRV